MKCGFVLLMINISWELPLRNTQLKNFLKCNSVQSFSETETLAETSFRPVLDPLQCSFIAESDVSDFWRLPTPEKGYPAQKGSSA